MHIVIDKKNAHSLLGQISKTQKINIYKLKTLESRRAEIIESFNQRFDELASDSKINRGTVLDDARMKDMQIELSRNRVRRKQIAYELKTLKSNYDYINRTLSINRTVLVEVNSIQPYWGSYAII
jgi:hypothetical protein